MPSVAAVRSRSAAQLVLAAGALVSAFALGAWSRGVPVVAAAAAADPLYQFTGSGPSSALTVYSAPEHSIYVYLGVEGGSSHVNCSFKLIVTRVGAPIDRQNCAPGSLF